MSTISASTTNSTAYKVTADTTGTLVLQTGATPTTAVTIGTDQNVTLAKGLIVGATAAPAFSAYQSASTSITASTLTKVLFNVELFDTNNNFASSRFTPTVEGYYQVNARVGLTSSVLTRGVAQIYKNGANVNSMEDTNGAAAYSSIGSALIYMNGSTDYLEIYVFIAGATTIYDGGATRTWFQAAMVRGA